MGLVQAGESHWGACALCTLWKSGTASQPARNTSGAGEAAQDRSARAREEEEGERVLHSLANRFTHCDSIRDLDRNRITIGRIDSNRFEVVIHSDFVVNQNLYHHALTLGA